VFELVDTEAVEGTVEVDKRDAEVDKRDAEPGPAALRKPAR
jgi:hypothetical protein